MSKSQGGFSEEYEQGQPTAAETVKPESHEKIVVDEKKYGLAKPKRIVIRGKITSD